FHSSSYEEEDGTIIYTGMPGGILLTIGDKTVYHVGDTALFSDLKLIRENNDIDLAIVLIGDNFTMGQEDALIACDWINVKKVVSINYNTLPVTELDPKAFTDKCATGEGIPLQVGESITL